MKNLPSSLDVRYRIRTVRIQLFIRAMSMTHCRFSYLARRLAAPLVAVRDEAVSLPLGPIDTWRDMLKRIFNEVLLFINNYTRHVIDSYYTLK